MRAQSIRADGDQINSLWPANQSAVYDLEEHEMRAVGELVQMHWGPVVKGG